MSDEAGAQGAKESGVEDAKQTEQVDAASQARLKELESQAAELKELKKQMAEKRAADEQKRLADAGQFEEALKLEQRKYAELEQSYRSEVKQLSLKAELGFKGINDDRAVMLFLDKWDPEAQSVSDYVDALKALPENAKFFSTTQSNAALNSPPPSSSGSVNTITKEQADAWKYSSDSKKREASLKFFDAYYKDQFRREHQ